MTPVQSIGGPQGGGHPSRGKQGRGLSTLAPRGTADHPNDPQPPTRSMPPRKRVNSKISMACKACQERRTKCSGGPLPCDGCRSRGTRCFFDPLGDKRRKTSLHNVMKESKSCSDAFDGLLRIVRDGPPPRLEALLDFIKKDTSRHEIFDYIQQHLESIEADATPGGLPDSAPATARPAAAAAEMYGSWSVDGPGSVGPLPEDVEVFDVHLKPDGESRGSSSTFRSGIDWESSSWASSQALALASNDTSDAEMLHPSPPALQSIDDGVSTRGLAQGPTPHAPDTRQAGTSKYVPINVGSAHMDAAPLMSDELSGTRLDWRHLGLLWSDDAV